METLGQMLARNRRMLGDKPFIIAGDETLTYAAFDRRTAQLAHLLARRGAGPGVPVGLYLPSNPTMAIGFWACQKLGAIPVPMSAMYRELELRNVIGRTDMPVLIGDAGTLPFLDPLRAELPALRHVLTAGDPAFAAELAAAPDEIEPPAWDPEAIAALFFTSGTTGVPKGTMQTQFNQHSVLRDMMCFHRTRFGTETYSCAVPLFTNYGCTVTLNLCLYAGGTLVLHERWDTRAVLDGIRRHRSTYFCGTPTMYAYLPEGWDPTVDDLSSLRLCTTGGSPVPQPVIRRFEALAGCRVLQVYGATESCGQSVMEPLYGARTPGSTGVPVGSARVAVVGDDGQPLPPGQVGEIRLSGDTIAKGYWRDPEATAKAFTADGWLSGDLGYLDADGQLFIVDRKKDVIIAGGHNIYPIEIESVLYQHAAVAVCAVIGIPDEAKGEIPVAVVVRAGDTAATGAELIAWCRQQLSAYKAPRRVYFTDEMPVQAAKIRKRELIDWIREGRLAPAD